MGNVRSLNLGNLKLLKAIVENQWKSGMDN